MSAFMSAGYIQKHFILDIFMEANNMSPDQTAPNLGPYHLQYTLPKNISRWEEQTTKAMTGGLKVKTLCFDFFDKYSKMFKHNLFFYHHRSW